jgi:hypothetical protein
MAGRKGWAKALRVIAIIFMGITAVFTLMAGIGTTCVALAAEKFSASMALIAPYKWVYILFVIITTAVGVMMVRATIMIIKSKDQAFRYSMISLLAGIVIGVIHVIVSRSIRGKSMPTDGVVYFTVITLLVFLIFRIPALWKEIDFSKPAGKNTSINAAAFTLIICGIAVLTAPLWGAATHTFIPGGVNWANAWPLQMNLAGSILCLAGIFLLAAPLRKKLPAAKSLQKHRSSSIL